MHEDSGIQYKSPVLDLEGGVFRKSISIASEQYLLSYMKKITGGSIPPPSAGIGLKGFLTHFINKNTAISSS